MTPEKDCGPTQTENHALTHYEFSDGTLTPGCVCGWYSPRRSHSDFERHIAASRTENVESPT